jgi:thioredoxin 1
MFHLPKKIPNMASSFQDLIQSQQPVLVDFYADWCGPCRMLAPELERLAQATQGQLKIVKVNVDKNPGAARQYGIQGIPAMILFRQGQILWRGSGYRTQAQLQQELAPFLSVTA